tara:strand:- start:564 stop:1067 length:504 start_codon:yes stop_codon:yes gene_type:complete
MALWGKSDSLFSTGTISVNLTTKVCTISTGTLPAAATIEGAVVTITGKGSAVILERTGNTTFTIVNTTGLDGTAISGVAYNISGQPVYLNEDSNYDGEEVYGVDTTEQGVVNGKTGDARKYAPAHAGWVGITTYSDMHGNLRVKTETLVASSSITGDAGDDTILPDS